MSDETANAPTRLYVARWPDGTAMILSADSMADVAERLDEVGDPGTCEVVALQGPLALCLRPKFEPTEPFYFDLSLDTLDDALDVQRAIMRAAFPLLHEMIEQSRDEHGEAHVDREEWSRVAARETERELRPSATWASAIATWWEEMSGTPPDRSAALRDHMRVTIPGEPVPSPSMRKHFEAEHARIRQRIDAALSGGPKRETGPRKKKAPAGKPAAKKKPPRGSGPGRSRR